MDLGFYTCYSPCINFLINSKINKLVNNSSRDLIKSNNFLAPIFYSSIPGFALDTNQNLIVERYIDKNL